MPRPRTISRRGYSSAEKGMLNHGHQFFAAEPCFGIPRRIPVDAIPPDARELMLDCWNDCGHEIMAKRLAERPGTRPWFWWLLALPENPRQPMDDEPDSPGTVPPWGHYPWGTGDGNEPSLHYLVRRQLLEPGELDRLRRMQADDAHRHVEYHRMYCSTAHCYPLPSWELAGCALVGGTEILTPAELNEAMPHLAVLRRHLEDR